MNVTAERRCRACKDGAGFERPFSMAYQPIVDVEAGEVFAYEALVRGPAGESAYSVLEAVDLSNRYAFDQACRVKAIELAAQAGLMDTNASLSINFLPNAVYQPAACIRATLKATEATGLPPQRIIFEITEGEEVVDHAHLKAIIDTYRSMGFRTAIDDFGAGFSNLRLLAQFQPDLLKIDMDLIRGIDADPVKRAIVRSVVQVCDDLGVTVVAEGIETAPEYEILRERGIRYIQGFLFAKPGFEHLPQPAWPDTAPVRAVA